MQSVEMNPMFLPDVQNNPQPSPHFELTRSAQNSGQNTGRSGTFSPSGPRACPVASIPTRTLTPLSFSSRVAVGISVA
jgi:hypothetical protein